MHSNWDMLIGLYSQSAAAVNVNQSLKNMRYKFKSCWGLLLYLPVNDSPLAVVECKNILNVKIKKAKVEEKKASKKLKEIKTIMSTVAARCEQRKWCG